MIDRLVPDLRCIERLMIVISRIGVTRYQRFILMVVLGTEFHRRQVPLSEFDLILGCQHGLIRVWQRARQ